MKTRYDPDRQAATDAAHVAARRDIYPCLFPGASLAYECHSAWTDERARRYDAEFAVDITVSIAAPERLRLEHPIPIYVQERFREPGMLRFDDLTITVWNGASDSPSELYKLAADYLAYGYYDSAADHFADWLVINVASVKRALALGELPAQFVPNNGKRQSFIGIPFKALTGRYGMRKAAMVP
jgi:hypothetical protein